MRGDKRDKIPIDQIIQCAERYKHNLMRALSSSASSLSYVYLAIFAYQVVNVHCFGRVEHGTEVEK